MNIQARTNEWKQNVDLPDGSNVMALIRELGLYPDGVLVFRNALVIPDDTLLCEADVIEVIRISSGG